MERYYLQTYGHKQPTKLRRDICREKQTTMTFPPNNMEPDVWAPSPFKRTALPETSGSMLIGASSSRITNNMKDIFSKHTDTNSQTAKQKLGVLQVASKECEFHVGALANPQMGPTKIFLYFLPIRQARRRCAVHLRGSVVACLHADRRWHGHPSNSENYSAAFCEALLKVKLTFSGFNTENPFGKSSSPNLPWQNAP